ncbi:MAG: hypothetical protein L0I09_00935 [Lactobacillus sp.]|nr:hypothetical protein [Lactobacillus sp.]
MLAKKSINCNQKGQVADLQLVLYLKQIYLVSSLAALFKNATTLAALNTRALALRLLRGLWFGSQPVL